MIQRISITTRNHTEFIDVTARIQALVEQSGVREGACLVYAPHTTAAVTLNENADPTVAGDIMTGLKKMIPWDSVFEHAEGNSAAHIKSSLLGTDKLIPVEGGLLKLGHWQGIFFCEFDGPRQREIFVKVIQ